MTTDIHDASEKGDIKRVQRCIQQGIDINGRKGWDGHTPLHLSAQNGHNEVVKTLIEAGADVDVKDRIWDGHTPLHLSAQNGHNEVVKTLIEAGADVDVKDRIWLSEGTPLHLSAQIGHNDVVRTLIEAGAAVDVKNGDNNTPLHLSAQNGHNDVVKTLIEAGAVVDVKNADGDTPLHLSALNGHNEVVKTLIEAGADVDVKDRTRDKNTPLHLSGTNVDVKKAMIRTPLHYAAINYHNDVVETLLQAGADTNLKDLDSETPLHLASSRGHNDVVEKLIRAGANVNMQGSNVRTPLHLAAINNHNDVVETLLQAGADTNLKDWDSETPLHLASTFGHNDVVEKLIRAGANVNIQESMQRTPLHLAANVNHKDVVEILLQAGADANLKDTGGRTARDLAKGKVMQAFVDFEKSVPKEIRALGIKAIYQYTAALGKDSYVSNVIRVMLVGHFGVGKTTIAMHLLERKVKHIDSTDGIDVYINQCLYHKESETWHTTGKHNEMLIGTKDYIRVDLTDFAGQLIFYTTHQTYLTRRGLYLLVFNLAKGLDGEVYDEDLHPSKVQRRHVIDFLEFWISTIITYAKGQQANYPKIVLIGTHRDRLKNDAALVGIKERISEQFGKLVTSKQLVVRDELFISARHMNDETRKIIRDIILEEGQQYPEFGERIPARWNALQEKLLQSRKERQYVISMDDVKSMNKELPTPLDEEELEIFLSYLHNMGYILYFSTPALKEKIVLDPKFIIDAMRSFITCERFVKRILQGNVWTKMRLTGQVKKTHILTTWRASGLEEHTEHLLGIMKKLDLVTEPMIYRSGKQVASDFFVVPCMINAAKPEGSTVSRVEEAQFVVEFSADTILPPAVFNRLVCSCLALWGVFEGHLYNGLVVLKIGKHHIIHLDRQVDKIVATLSHKESRTPDVQLCRAMKQFLSETIDRIVSIYTSSKDSPILCRSSEIDADVEKLQAETEGSSDQSLSQCRCDEFTDCELEDVNLMRIAKQLHLHGADVHFLCSTLLNNAQMANSIEIDYGNFKGDTKAFYVFHRWTEQAKVTVTGLREIFKNHLEGFDQHIICRSMERETSLGLSIDSSIQLSKVYPEFLNVAANQITHEYVHLGLELGLTLKEIEAIEMENGSICERVRAILLKWSSSLKEEALVLNLAKAFHRCGKGNLAWIESEFERDLEKESEEEESRLEPARSKCSIL